MEKNNKQSSHRKGAHSRGFPKRTDGNRNNRTSEKTRGFGENKRHSFQGSGERNKSFENNKRRDFRKNESTSGNFGENKKRDSRGSIEKSRSFGDNKNRRFNGEKSKFVGGERNSFSGGEKRFGADRNKFGNRGNTGGRRFGGDRNKFGDRGNGGGRRFGGGGGRRKFGGERIDVNRFINKVSVVEESAVFVPTNHFVDFHIEDILKKAIAKREFILPTPIQDKIIPHILEGQDVVGLANTGTGKTGAFLIPLINKVLKNKNERVIIIAPTRELAQQIDEELKLFTRTMAIFSVVCVGGTNVGKQLRDLSRYHNFIIGTPGRIKDMVERGKIDLSKFGSIVLDEADRMLDMGFVPDIKFVMSKMPEKRQGLFFSATLPKEIERMINDFLKSPVTISVKTGETSKNIEQDIVRVSKENKFDKLCEILKEPEFKKTLIFTRTKHGAEKLAKDLAKSGVRSDSIHGDKSQSRRQKTLLRFKKNEVDVLVATDVAARGLDIDGVSHVINYDIPETHDDYVHRIGRTGRGSNKGKALTFVS